MTNNNRVRKPYVTPCVSHLKVQMEGQMMAASSAIESRAKDVTISEQSNGLRFGTDEWEINWN